MKRKRITALLLAALACGSMLGAGAAWTEEAPTDVSPLSIGIIVPFGTTPSV